jgi:hypothetical protein
LSRVVHNKTLQITGAFDKLSIEEKDKPKTRGTAHEDTDPGGDTTLQVADMQPHDPPKTVIVDPRTHKVLKTISYTPTPEMGDLPKAVKWAVFTQAMVRLGFAIEELQGSAWQFTPGDSSKAERNIQFHEPHPDSDILM